MINQTDQQTLLDIARTSIRHGLQYDQPLSVNVKDYAEALQQHGACFVTLTINEQLRGCIGTLEAYRPLVEDLAANAFAAAFRDPRFAPLNEHEYPQLEYHISVLNPAEDFPVRDEQDLLQQLRPGIDGLILEEGFHRATFLPSVWESLDKPEEFLRHLKMKAGLYSDYWSDSMNFKRYTVQEFHNDTTQQVS